MARGIVKGGLNDGGSNIKSIQRGVLAFGAGVLSLTVTVASVDVNKCLAYALAPFVFSPANDAFSVEITNSTTLTITRNDATTTETVTWLLEEYNNVKSRQVGSVLLSASNLNVTISSINIAKSRIVVSFKSTASVDGLASWVVVPSITNGTTINFLCSGTNVITVFWQVLEFN